MKNAEIIIIDVRTPEEFNGGHVSGSLNIPLQEIQNRIEEIRTFQKPIVLCCASGYRSGRATAYLQEHGISCQNGGSWLEVNAQIN